VGLRIEGSCRSGANALPEDRSNTVLVSAAGAWEIATKFRLGRMPEAEVLIQDMPG
jgi:PIN domain nuclease of toxin-antitoxin system